MESLLQHAFQYLSSPDQNRIRKGIRQVETLLAQICLLETTRDAQSKRNSSPVRPGYAIEPRRLDDVVEDLAFVEFFRLQEHNDGNVASRLFGSLATLLENRNTYEADAIILSALNLLQGLLLLHSPSRSLMGLEHNMELLVTLLDAGNPEAILSSALAVLSVGLLGEHKTARTLEKCQALPAIYSLMKMPRLEGTDGFQARAQECLQCYLLLNRQRPQSQIMSSPIPTRAPPPTAAHILNSSPSYVKNSAASKSLNDDRSGSRQYRSLEAI